MPDGLGHNTYEDPALLPAPLARLHRKVMRAKRAENERKLKARDVDEAGRTWRGLVQPKPPRQTNR